MNVQATPPCSWQAFKSINREEYFQKPKRLVVPREIISSLWRPLYTVILCLRKSTDAPWSLYCSVKVTEVRHKEKRKTSQRWWELVPIIKPIKQILCNCIILVLQRNIWLQFNWTPLHWPTFSGVLIAPPYLLHFPQQTDTMRGIYFKCHSFMLTVECYSLLFGTGRP